MLKETGVPISVGLRLWKHMTDDLKSDYRERGAKLTIATHLT